MSFVIDEDDANLALQLLHAHFFAKEQAKKKKTATRGKKSRVAPVLLTRAQAASYRENRT